MWMVLDDNEPNWTEQEIEEFAAELEKDDAAADPFPNRLFDPKSEVDPSTSFDQVMQRFCPSDRLSVQTFVTDFMTRVFTNELTHLQRTSARGLPHYYFPSSVEVYTDTNNRYTTRMDVIPDTHANIPLVDAGSVIKVGIASLCVKRASLRTHLHRALVDTMGTNAFSLEHCRQFLVTLGAHNSQTNEENFCQSLASFSPVYVASVSSLHLGKMLPHDIVMMMAFEPIRDCLRAYHAAWCKLPGKPGMERQMFEHTIKLDGSYKRMFFDFKNRLANRSIRVSLDTAKYFDTMVSRVSSAYHSKTLPCMIKPAISLLRYTPVEIKL
jgi:hypothetical protein